MKTINDLGVLVKQKHPEYNHIPDDELGRMIQAKFPGAYSEFIDTGISVELSGAIIETDNVIDTQLNPEILAIVKNYNPNAGVIRAWIKSLSSEMRGRNAQALSIEQQQFIEMALRYEGSVLTQKKSLVEYQRFLADNQFHLINLKFEVYLREQAARENIGIDGYLRVQEARMMSEIRIAEHLATAEKPPDKETEAELSRIRIDEERRKKEIELEHQRNLADSQLEFEIIARDLTDQKKIEIAQKKIDAEYITIGEIEARTDISEETKDRLVSSHLRTVKMYEEQQDEAHRKIIRAENKDSDL